MGNRAFFVVATSLAFLALSSEVFAAATNKLETSLPQTSPGLIKKTWRDLEISLWGWSYGPSFQDFNSGLTPKVQGSTQAPVNITTQVGLTLPSGIGSYRFIVQPNFVIYPMAQPGLNLGDSPIGIQGTVYENGGFSWWTRPLVAFPLSPGSQKAGMLFAPAMINNFVYQFRNSGLQLKSTVIPGVHVYNSGVTTSSLYYNQNIYYSFNSKWMAVALSELYFGNAPQSSLLNLVNNQAANVGVGFRYTFGPEFFIQPFIGTYPASPLSLQSVNVAFIFGGQPK